ncbi:hypothetical protein GCM10020221_22430 [Streptomyces thioluteus]|uniref:Uncharacterized protein n=1 Tax=Streptomyces thioluteus TaxID=66431 RepID=A0ABP6J969_STRTU
MGETATVTQPVIAAASSRLPVAGVVHGAAQPRTATAAATHRVERDLDGTVQAEAEQEAVQGLVGEAVRLVAEAGAGEVVDPVRPGVVRRRGPGEGGGGGERRPRGDGRAAAVGEPEQGDEEQDGRLEGGREAAEDTGGAAGARREPGQATGGHDEEDGQDAGLAEGEGVADGQREHGEAHRDGRGEQGRAPGERSGQRAGGDEREGDDEQQGADRPADAETVLGGAGERSEDETPERGAGELVVVVEGTARAQHAVVPYPGGEFGEPAFGRPAQDDGGLTDGQDAGDQPEGAQRQDGPRARTRRTCRSAPFCIHHAPAAPPVDLLGHSRRALCDLTESWRTPAGHPQVTYNLPQMA